MLAAVSVFGNLCRANATISGAEGGCQAEVGVAEAMAAAAVCYWHFMTNSRSISLSFLLNQVERAATNSLRNRLGLTCDPVDGLVIDPCIDRNGVVAVQAYHTGLLCIAEAYDAHDKKHFDFDATVAIMNATGLDLNVKYRETGDGGHAASYGINDGRDNNYLGDENGNEDIDSIK